MDEKELINRIRNSLRNGMSRAEITRKMQARGYKLEYIDLLIKKAKSKKGILFKFILIFSMCLLAISSAGYVYLTGYAINIPGEKISIEKPVINTVPKIDMYSKPVPITNQSNTDKKSDNKTKNNDQEIKITPQYLTYILNEIGAYKLHKNPFNNEEAVISFKISGKDYYSEIDEEIESFEGDKEGDILISTSSSNIIEAISSNQPEKYFKESVEKGSTSIKIIAGETELFLKGYKSLYETLGNQNI